MFSLISGFVNWYFAIPTYKVLIIGDEKAGKSTYLEHLKHIYTGRGCPLDYVLPTSGLNLTKIKYSETEILFWDISGKEAFRKLWEQYYDEIHGLIYVVDSNSEDIAESIRIFNKVTDDKRIQTAKIPILILLNKIDLGSKNENKIKQLYINLDYNKLHKKHFLVKEISALKGTGIEESIRWLFNSMADYNDEDESEGKNEIIEELV